MKKFLALTVLFLPFIGIAQEHAKILEYNTTFFVSDKNKAEIQENYKIQINSKEGYSLANYYEYVDQFRKVTSVTLTLTTIDGKKIKKVRQSDGHEFGINASYEIGDGKIFNIDPDYQQYPFIVEVNATVQLKGYLQLPTWVPRSTFNVSVDKATLEIVSPVTFPIIIKEENINGEKTIEGTNVIYRYEVKNLPAIDKKIRYQDFYDLQPKVMSQPEEFMLDNTVGRNTSWKEFGNWFYGLNNEPYVLTAETKAFIDDLGEIDDFLKIKHIYEYMQDRTRYVSIQLGIGGYKSISTEEVEKTGYGDCKALTTYMKSMLHYAGLNANYILVRAGRDVPEVKVDYPGNQFNHVYLGVPLSADTLYLECTNQMLPTGYSGSFTDDRNVLWIEENESQVIRSKVYSHNENIQNNKAKIIINEYGDALINLNVHNTGTFFDEVSLYKNSTQDRIENYNNVRFNYRDYVIKSFDYNQKQRDLAEFDLHYEVEVKGLGKSVSDRLILPVNFLEPLGDYIDQNELMKYSSIKRGITIEDEIEVELPTNYWIYNLPEKETVSSIFGNYEISMDFDGQKLHIKRRIVLYKGNYINDQYEDFKNFYKSIEKIERQKLVLNSKT